MASSKHGVAPKSKTTRGPGFACGWGCRIASPHDDDDDDDEDDDEDDDDEDSVGLLSSRTMLVPTPAIDHAETAFQCVDDIIIVRGRGVYSKRKPVLGWMRRNNVFC
jgi:hypothetical protein